jgi:hypothetical protein
VHHGDRELIGMFGGDPLDAAAQVSVINIPMVFRLFPAEVNLMPLMPLTET